MPTYLDYEQIWANIALSCREKRGFANEPPEALVIDLCRERCKEFEWHDCIWLARKLQREEWERKCAERKECKGCIIGGV